MTKLLKFFLADFRDGKTETRVTLSKSREQQDGPLEEVNFNAITMNSKITPT